ncbi:unnamed protein product [Closterium sp. NIES-64]|nr:unnamed protein product [Closterium sp. NIES-64]
MKAFNQAFNQPGGAFRVLLVTFAIVHFVRIFLIPTVAWLIGSEEFADTERVVRIIGFRPSGPCSLPRPVSNCTVNERIHIVLVSAQWDREPFTRDETEVILKSILMSTQCRLFFHFMVSGEAEEWGISDMMEQLGAVPFDAVGPVSPNLVRHDIDALVDQISYDPNHDDKVADDPPVGYTIHPIPVCWVRHKAELLGINITHHSGEAGFAKLFLPEILWNVRRAIYLDVDMVAAEDLGALWGYFREMDADPDLLLFMGDNHPTAYGPRSRYPFCSCQLIMDLDRLRRHNLTRLVMEAFGEQKAMEVWGFRPGDQWVFTMMCMNNPDKCRTLPKIWNVSGCSKPRFLGLNARDKDQNGTCWRMAHFNCIGVRDNRYYALANTDWEDMRQAPYSGARHPTAAPGMAAVPASAPVLTGRRAAGSAPSALGALSSNATWRNGGGRLSRWMPEVPPMRRRGRKARVSARASTRHLPPIPTAFPPLPDPALPPYEQFVLPNGLRVFLLEDHELGLVGGQLLVKGGAQYEAPDKVGVAGMMAAVQRSGGTQQYPEEHLDDTLEAMAASIETSAGTSSLSASFRCLQEDAPTLLPLLRDGSRHSHPALPVNPLAFLPTHVLLSPPDSVAPLSRPPQWCWHRCYQHPSWPSRARSCSAPSPAATTDPGRVASRELQRLLYSPASPRGRYPLAADVARISLADLRAFHAASYSDPSQAVLGVWGDFDARSMRALLEDTFLAWPAAPATPARRAAKGRAVPYWGPEEGVAASAAGVYVVDRPGLTQSIVRVGELGITISDEDVFALDVLNAILNGFGGRLFDQVRSREGLAYSVSGSWSPGVDHRGAFVGGGETRAEAVGQFVTAVQRVLGEATLLPPSPGELQEAKDRVLNSFVFNFADRYLSSPCTPTSPICLVTPSYSTAYVLCNLIPACLSSPCTCPLAVEQQLSRIMTYELFGIDQDFIFEFKRRVEALSPEAVLAAAQRRLHPGEQPIVVVADAAAVMPQLSSLGLSVTLIDPV